MQIKTSELFRQIVDKINKSDYYLCLIASDLYEQDSIEEWKNLSPYAQIVRSVLESQNISIDGDFNIPNVREFEGTWKEHLSMRIISRVFFCYAAIAYFEARGD